ncbi:hypothetical protein CHU32_15100 [Superficieibacter electus]|uniref:Uncharacterized protein n=1 Tax=Superficieibacter electus TaxID=2022662 RepID=A0A2P5GNP1_9ENTR|nr:DUF5691 domain-containing protein [Superficieibacter electus]POP43987.1 hypothetical protein CHU33_13410 [Superficieibacter electus]POP48159.1 hypothetical protein CHU32_15100 [Superficieibacter electus]
MTLLNTLANQVIGGTEKRVPQIPVMDNAIGHLLSELTEQATPEQNVLRAAGILSLCEHAGWQPAQRENLTLTPAPAETREVIDDRGTLQTLLNDAPQRLRYQALTQVATSGMRPAPRLLPALLELGRKEKLLSPAVKAVLGERGRWLANLNPQWDWVCAIPDENTAAEARERLTQDRSDLHARERAALLDVLAQDLSSADEPLLDAFLCDRSKEVRLAAAEMLSTLPDSAYVARMTSRVSALLHEKEETSLLLRLKKRLSGERVPEYQLDAPEQFADEWKQDALEEKKGAGERLGQRAWWLYQLIRAVPLRWWQQQLQATPAELLAWAANTDWQAVLLRAWLAATLRERNSEWAEAFVSLIPEGHINTNLADVYIDLFELLALMPLAQRQERIFHQLVAFDVNKQKSIRLGNLCSQLERTLPLEASPFDPQLAAQVVTTLHQWVQQKHAVYDYELRHAIGDIACLLPADMLDDVINHWPRDASQEPCCEEVLHRLSIVVAWRKNLQTLFSRENAL